MFFIKGVLVLTGICAAIGFSPKPAAAQKCDVDSGYRGYGYSIDRYKNRELFRPIRELKDLPAAVQSGLTTYFDQRVGKEFASRMKLEWGTWLDLEGFKLNSPAEFSRDQTLAAYDLAFSFSDSRAGLKSYYFKVMLSDAGSITNEVLLPAVANDPEKSKLIPCRQAYRIAAGVGFPLDQTSASFDYDEVNDSFVWIITDDRETTADDPAGGLVAVGHTFKKVAIDANTGSILRIYKDSYLF